MKHKPVTSMAILPPRELLRLPVLIPSKPKTLEAEKKVPEEELYKCANLSNSQKEVFFKLFNSTNGIFLLQAAPGTGKSFVLRTLKNELFGKTSIPACVVIFKHDLLSHFETNANIMTVTSFFMKSLKLNYGAYKAIDKQLSYNQSTIEIYHIVVALLKRAHLPEGCVNSTIIFDEYTLVSKVLVVVLLTLVDAYKLKIVFSGDKNQLQNIHNCAHFKASSFEIIRMCEAIPLTLTEVMRCKNRDYNSVIAYISQFSSNSDLNAFAHAMLAVIFPKQVAIGKSDFTDLHLFHSHAQAAKLIQACCVDLKLPHRFYEVCRVEPTKKYGGKFKPTNRGRFKTLLEERYQNNVVDDPYYAEKFVPYIPLVVGALYYVRELRERSVSILKKLHYDRTGKQVISLTMQLLSDPTNIFTLSPETNNAIVFDPHREFLIGTESGYILLNFPIYSFNWMSMHKVQGVTIPNNMNLRLFMNLGTWHYCYVGVSRVQSFEQITKVDIPNIASNSVSAILSVKSPTDEALKSFDSVINGEQLASRMKTFHYYDLSVGERDNPHICFEAMCLVKKFYRTTDLVERRKFFRSIQTKYSKFFSKTLTPPENTSFPLTNETGAGYGILKNRRSLMALSRVQNDLVVSVWLKEFLELEKQEGNTPDWWSERYLVVETMSLYNECNLSDRLPPPGMSTEQMIENASSILVGDEDDLPEGTQMSRLISKTLNEFGRNTWQFSKSTFLAKTYRKKLKQEAITKPWLITQLTAILQ